MNERIIRNAAIFAGHNPGRAISATGTLRLTLKSNTDLSADIPGGRVVIINRTRIKNKFVCGHCKNKVTSIIYKWII